MEVQPSIKRTAVPIPALNSVWVPNTGPVSDSLTINDITSCTDTCAVSWVPRYIVDSVASRAWWRESGSVQLSYIYVYILFC